MKRSGVEGVRWLLRAAALTLPATCPLGCMTATRCCFRAEAYRIELTLDPAAHRLLGRTTLDLVADVPVDPSAAGPVAFELLLHPELKVRRISADTATVRRCRVGRDIIGDDGVEEFHRRRHVVVLDHPVEALSLVVEYDGALWQDVAAGERPGEIHNFEMRAHVGEEGIYLGGGYWYPQPELADGAAPAAADFTLLVDPVKEMVFVAGAQSDPALAKQSGRQAWRSPYPLESMVLVGGRHEVHRKTHRGRTISLHLKPTQAEHVQGLFEAVTRNLDRYEPLIGPYPASEFAIVDNFFSSGFAFPTFTLLSSAVIDMGERSQTSHGYIDHEMLHCWWGNGVQVDPRDGNWCEALASYAANYYGYVLDGDEEEARRKRRNYAHFLSRLTAEEDKPLGTFGREGGCGRGIGYDKGAAVFHMLARRMGQDRFWAAIRRFSAEYLGRFASWEDIQRACEAEHDGSLEAFFRQWVRSSGAPNFAIDRARYEEADAALVLAISQSEPPFELDVPIRITDGAGHQDVVVHVDDLLEEVVVPVASPPVSVELDPDYHVFRRIPLEHIVPTTAATRSGGPLTWVVPEGEVADAYVEIQEMFAAATDEDRSRRVVAGSVEPAALAEANVLILGDALHDKAVSAFLTSIGYPLKATDGGFRFADVVYLSDGDAILCTAAHPHVPGGGVTVLFANSEAAIPRPRIIPFYDRSVVIFRSGVAVSRHDLEYRSVIPVEGGPNAALQAPDSRS